MSPTSKLQAALDTIKLPHPRAAEASDLGAARSGRTPASRIFTWRFLPGLVVFAAAFGLVTLPVGGVDPVSALSFAAYFLICIVLPGVLVWRAFGPRLTYRIEEYALGACVGYVLETLVRIGASAAGVPQAAAIVPVAVIAAVTLWRPWRRYWRSRAKPIPVPAAWAYAVISVIVLVWLGYSYYRLQPVSWTGTNEPYADLVHTLAYATDVAHRWPPEFPYVVGEPLKYHWFFGAHLAEAHTMTGVDFPTLLLRLYLVPMLLVLIVTAGALGTRMSGRLWAGPLAGGIAYLAQELNLIPLRRAIETSDSYVGSIGGAILWWSPSLPFAAVTLAPALLLAIDLARDRDNRGVRALSMGSWFLFTLAVVASAGAKSTALPVLIAGLGAVVALTVVVRRRLHYAALVAFGLACTVYIAAALTVYGGESYGVTVDLFGFVDATDMGLFLGFETPNLGLFAGALAMVIVLTAHVAPWAGSLLLLRSSSRSDPAAWLAAGAAACGLIALIGLYHPGQSQLYFLRSAFPLLAAAAAWGIVAGITTTGWRVALVVGTAIGVGAGAGLLIQSYDGVHPGDSADWLARYGTMLRPFALLGVVVVLVGAGYVLLRHRWSPGWQGIGVPVLVIVVILGAAGIRTPAQAAFVGYHEVRGTALPEPEFFGRGFAGDSVRAAQWLRDHSDVDDVVMTNVHCLNGPYQDQPGAYCDNLAFWMAAYSERRFYVHGWGYTASNAAIAEKLDHSTYVNAAPFWDQPRLRRNDAFLAAPTSAEARALRREFGIRWVFVDTEFGAVSPQITAVARLRYSRGPAAIYEFR